MKRSFKGFSFFLGLCVVMSLLHADHTHYRRSFWNPIYYQFPLNYCLSDNQTCGLPVATAYCKWMGYDKADHILINYNVGQSRYFISKLYCKNWRCNGFKTIQCVGRIKHHPPQRYAYRKIHFVAPRYNGNRVAWCADGMQKGCGKGAAYAFCRRLGYIKTIGFERAEHVGATEAISNQRYCFGAECAGFKYIDCYR